MRTYELLFIVAPNEGDETVDALVEQLRGVAEEQGATVAKVDKMGRRSLAYSIRRSHQNFTEGTYVILTIEGSGTEIAELERRLRVAESVIRHLTVRIDEDLKRAEKFKAKRRARQAAGGGRQQRGRAMAGDAEDEEEEVN